MPAGLGDLAQAGAVVALSSEHVDRDASDVRRAHRRDLACREDADDQLADLAGDDLAVLVAWQVVDRDDVRRALVVGQRIFGEPIEIERTDRPGRHDGGGDDAAVLVVGQPDDRGFDDRRMPAQRLLDLERHDLLPASIDHVVDPPEHLHHPIVGSRGQVAGAQPAVLELCGCCGRIAVIADHGRWRSDRAAHPSPRFDRWCRQRPLRRRWPSCRPIRS